MPVRLDPENVFGHDVLLEAGLGRDKVLHYSHPVREDWIAIITDGTRLGVLEGSLMCCADGNLECLVGEDGTFDDAVTSLLEDVYTFQSWTEVKAYLDDQEKHYYYRHQATWDEMIAYVNRCLPLDVATTAKSLRGGEQSLDEAIEMARLVLR